MRGEHHHLTYRDRFRGADKDIEIQANHTRRNRMPQGHELSRQFMRGQAFRMIEEEERSWRIIFGRACVGVIRENPSGSYSCGMFNEPAHRSPKSALRRLACQVLRIDPNAVQDDGAKLPR
ncbi:hypothetical protein FHW79_006481 [Azospirillum sp. OGB3]|uniref:hypothetical protein n=1 Tax=Azospirillum sp. OGB3 TaxID=2587012 RepID=UPI0016064142|nr:hypothetical protein [Azospirillum sp. OGB3]MBB3268805.1 hypothetical protein [Azospirillum sp. OGB3]